MWRIGQEDRIERTMREVLANDENAEVRRRAAKALAWREVAGITDRAEQKAAQSERVQALLGV